MTAPLPPTVTERVAASTDRTLMTRNRAASLASQVSPTSTLGAATQAGRERLLTAHAVAAAFYQAQLAGPDGGGPRRYLADRGVPVNGPVLVGYAPDRPTALVNELRRHGFADVEILASGLAATGRGGALVDRFRGRVMIGVRDHTIPNGPVVGFVGQAPPGVDPPLLHSPTTAIYRPRESLLGLTEQQQRAHADVCPVIAADPLSVVAAAADPHGPLMLMPCSPALTAGQVAALTGEVDTAAGVVVTVTDGDAGRRAAERAYAALAPAYQHPARPGPLLAARPDTVTDTRPLLDAVVTARVDWALARFTTADGRTAAARAVRAMLAGIPADTVAHLHAYIARHLEPSTVPAATEPSTPDTAVLAVPAPLVLEGTAAPTGPPPAPVASDSIDQHPPAVVRPAVEFPPAAADPPDTPMGQAIPAPPSVESAPPPPADAPAADAPSGDESAAGEPVTDVDDTSGDVEHDDGLGSEESPDPSADTAAAALTGPARPDLPPDATAVEGVHGYYYTHIGGQTVVYGPDHAPVMVRDHTTNRHTLMVDGVPLPAAWYSPDTCALLVARQHQAARLPAEQRDRVRIEIVPDRTARAGYIVEVHGTEQGHAGDERACRDAGHFLWSGRKRARVTSRKWTPQRVEENFARLLREFVRQGRSVLVAHPTAAVVAAPAAAVPVRDVAATPEPQTQPELAAPQEVSDEQLLEAVRREERRVGYGIRTDDEAAGRLEVLQQDRQERVLRRLASVPDPATFDDATLAAERQWLRQPFASNAFALHSDGDKAIRGRLTALHEEQAARTARVLLNGAAPAELDDAALDAAYKDVANLWSQMRVENDLHPALAARRRALLDERVERRVRHYQARPEVTGLSAADLVAEDSELNGAAAADRDFTTYPAVTQARQARQQAIEAELGGRDADRYTAELARVTSSGRARLLVTIDGMPDDYGLVRTLPTGRFVAMRRYTDEQVGTFDTRAAAVAALVNHYDTDPETYPQRTWGPPQRILMPTGARDALRDSVRNRSDLSPEQQRLREILLGAEGYTSATNPLTGKSMRCYPLQIEVGLLGELGRLGERATMQLHERAANTELPRTDRDKAKRRVPTMGAALSLLHLYQRQLADDGVDTDRRAVDEQQVAAQLAALAGSVEPDSPEGGSGDQPVQPSGPRTLDAAPAPGAGADERPGAVLHDQERGDPARGDRSAGSAGAGPGTGADLSGAGGTAQPDPGRRGTAGARGAAAPAGGPAGSAGAAEPGSGRAGGDPRGSAGPVTPFRADPADIPRERLARAAANLAAIEVLRRLEDTGQAATVDERRVLARWSGWGSVPTVFAVEPDAKDPVYGQDGAREGRYQPDHDQWEQYSPVRTRLRELLDPFEWAAASRATLSAHYTPQALAETMWAGVRAFGFDGGEVLEAGCGAGVFFGTAPTDLGPDAVRLTGVELDPTTARICAFIYPHANVLAESFADTDAPAGAFDLAIGNVPFANVPFGDRRHPGHSLHNGFLVKQLSLVRPGGLVVAITSRWTLDGEDEAARMALAGYGDLVGAWRLPAGVFEAAGVNKVVVNVLVLRRRPEGQALADPSWLDAPRRELNGSTQTVSAWFDQHPECVLGELTTRSSPYGPKVTVTGDPTTALATLATALRQTAAEAAAAGRGWLPHPDGVRREPLALQTARDKHAHDYTGRLYRGDDGRIWQHVNGADPIEAVPADGATDQLAALMQLRDVAVELKELDRTGDDPASAEVLRTQLRGLYTAYTTAHGPLSRPRQTRLAASSAVRAQAHAEGRKVRDDERGLTAWGWFREDPDAAAVLALDTWDHRTEAPVPSEVLTRRPGTRHERLEHTDDPLVALAAVMGATGQVDLDAIATLLGADADADAARRQLGTAVFDNPTTDRVEHAGTYLSGAVRRKLDEARAAAATDPTYAVNVAALEAVQPAERRLGQFTPQLGAHWIPAPLVQGFLHSYLADPTLRVDHDDHYGWAMVAGKVPDAVNAVKGTERRSALQIARAVLGRGSLTVSDVVGDKGATEVNEDATRAVRQRADAMRSAFEEYVTADSTRVALLTDAYNRIMNGHVVRNYDGLAPTLTGFTTERTPHSHQLAGAARMQAERGVILAHEVGLGKTTTMIIGSQALKTAGQITKPFTVVQPHLARQWLDEARFCYPAADIRLVTSDMLASDGRRRTLEWLRSNTPDLTIFTEEAFTSIRMSPEYQEHYEFRELADLREQILRERGTPDTALAVMRLEQRLITMEARLRRAAAPMRTPGELYFDDLGFDYALVDELHRFKGVGFRSRQAGGDEARLRGIDLHQKLTHMHALAEAAGGRPTVTGGTGTPLVNSIAEQYTMLALIAPQVLREYQVDGPDLWAETFGQRVQRIEMAPDGSGLKFVERFSRFTSKRAMKTMWGLVADTKRADDVGVPRPAIAGGGPRLTLVDATVDQQARLATLVTRGAAIHAGAVSRDQDNMLAVTGEGRAVAVDARLVDASAPPGTKLATVADWFAERYHASKDRVYAVSTADPTPHPTPGALLIGFLNQGTPGGGNKGNFDAYAELRTLCAQRGVPADRIAFVQEHNRSPDQLAELYRRCREGEVSIILASTGTMGTGANVQNRALALAHIDLDWTPAAMEQRDGRIVRWGNQNPEVEVAIFALRGSMDSWQAGLLASKAEGLRDIQRPDPGDDTSDTVLEVDDNEWDYATMAAEIGGNPYMGQLLQARVDLASLEADRRNHAADRLRQAELLAAKTEEAAQTRAAIARRDDALPMITPVRGEDFTITIGPTTYDQRTQAAPVLRQTVTTTLMQHRTPGTGPWQVLGRFGGLPFGMRAELTTDGQLQAQIGFDDLRHSEAVYSVDDLTKPKVGATMLGRLATALERAGDHQHLDHERLPTLDAEIALLQQQQGELDFGPRIDHARRRAELLDDIVGAIVERDKLPELRPEDLDTARYPTEQQRQRAIADRRAERQPLQAKVDAAAAVLAAFDRDHPPPTAPSTTVPTAPTPQVEQVETVQQRLDRLQPYTVPGPGFMRAVSEAVMYARMKINAGFEPWRDLVEGEVSAGLRPRSDLGQGEDTWRRPPATPRPPASANQTATSDAESGAAVMAPSPSSPSLAAEGPPPEHAETRQAAMRDLYAEAVAAGLDGPADRHDPLAAQAADSARQADDEALSMIPDREPLVVRHAELVREQTLGTAFAADRRGVQDLLRQVAQDPQRTSAHREAAAYYIDRIPVDVSETTIGSEAFLTEIAAVEADIATLSQISAMLREARVGRDAPDSAAAEAAAAYDAEVAAEFGTQIPYDSMWRDTRTAVEAAARRRAEADAYTAAHTQAAYLASRLVTQDGQACAATTLKHSRWAEEDIRLRVAGAEFRRDAALAEVRSVIGARVATREAERVAHEQHLAREAASPKGLDRADIAAAVTRIRASIDSQGGLRDKEETARDDRRRLKKANRIPAAATIKQLPVHQRMAAEEAVRLIDQAARARIAAINNQIQANLVQAELDANPDLRPNTRRELERARQMASELLATPAGADRIAQERDRALAVWRAVAPGAGQPGETGEPTPEMLDGLDDDQRGEVWRVAEQIGIEAGRRLAAQWRIDTAQTPSQYADAIELDDVADDPVAEEDVVAAVDGASVPQPDQPSTEPPVITTPPAEVQLALFDDPRDGLPERRMLAKVASRQPAEPIGVGADGQPTVLVEVVANGTYGTVSGLDIHRNPVTATGYVLSARPLGGGIGGWSQETQIVVELGEHPDGPATHTLQTPTDARLTVLATTPGQPASTPRPWLRMPTEHQILAARDVLGLRVEVRDGPVNELWSVEGCPEKLAGEVAWWLFGGSYRSWDGRAQPQFEQRHLDAALAAGRLHLPTAQPPQTTAEPAPTSEQREQEEDRAEPLSAALTPFTPIEQAIIRNAVADQAADYFGGPLGLGRDSAARYVSEGPLSELADRHGLGTVWDAVAAVIDADPTVLERDAQTRTATRAEREAHAEQLAETALAEFKQGAWNRASDLIDQAELIDPTYRPGRSEHNPFGYRWDEIRAAIERRSQTGGAAALARQSFPKPATPQRPTPAASPPSSSPGGTTRDEVPRSTR